MALGAKAAIAGRVASETAARDRSRAGSASVAGCGSAGASRSAALSAFGLECLSSRGRYGPEACSPAQALPQPVPAQLVAALQVLVQAVAPERRRKHSPSAQAVAERAQPGQAAAKLLAEAVVAPPAAEPVAALLVAELAAAPLVVELVAAPPVVGLVALLAGGWLLAMVGVG